jgi:hypothetical protein
MRPVILTMYVVMALWLFVVSVLRLVLSAGSGVPVDGLPFVTGGLGLLALLILIPAGIRAVLSRLARRGARPGTRDVER